MSYTTPFRSSVSTSAFTPITPVTPRAARTDPVRHGALLQRMQHMGSVQPQLTEVQQPCTPAVGLAWKMSGNGPTEVVITRQEPSLRDCIRELPSESVLPHLEKCSDFDRFWAIFDKAASDNVWPDSLILDILRHRSSEDMKDELEFLGAPNSRKELEKDLRMRFFSVTNFATVRNNLRSSKQYLRESLPEWEKRLKDINKGRIDLNNAEGLQLYKDAVLPVYRTAPGKTIMEFMESCKAQENDLRDAYGEQAFSRTTLFVNKGQHEDYVDQLNSYERALMGTDIKKLLERLRPSDFQQAFWTKARSY